MSSCLQINNREQNNKENSTIYNYIAALSNSIFGRVFSYQAPNKIFSNPLPDELWGKVNTF